MCALNRMYSFLSCGSLPSRMPTVLGASTRLSTTCRGFTVSVTPASGVTVRAVALRSAAASTPRAASAVASRISSSAASSGDDLGAFERQRRPAHAGEHPRPQGVGPVGHDDHALRAAENGGLRALPLGHEAGRRARAGGRRHHEPRAADVLPGEAVRVGLGARQHQHGAGQVRRRQADERQHRDVAPDAQLARPRAADLEHARRRVHRLLHHRVALDERAAVAAGAQAETAELGGDVRGRLLQLGAGRVAAPHRVVGQQEHTAPHVLRRDGVRGALDGAGRGRHRGRPAPGRRARPARRRPRPERARISQPTPSWCG